MLNAQLKTSGDAVDDLFAHFGADCFEQQPSADNTPTLWLQPDKLQAVLARLKPSYPLMLDLFGVDERQREHKPAAAADFTAVYHLMNTDAREELRLKVAAPADGSGIPTATGVYPVADWYEREAWDMLGIEFSGHPNLRRILLPPTWEGHALRKEHPARATEMEPFSLSADRQDLEQEALRFVPISPYMFRQAAEDYTIARGTAHETTVQAGTNVLVLTQSAMFDPYAYTDPDEFKPGRNFYHNFNFGFASHDCLGKYVGMEMLPEMVRQVILRTDIKADGPIDYKDGPFPEELNLSW